MKKNTNTSHEMNDDVYLCNPLYNQQWRDEFKEIDKHEILVKICSTMGECPSNFSKAEQIFDNIKFEMTRYVLHHEYCKGNSIRSNLLLWLEGKINPGNAEKLSNFLIKYLKG